MLSTLLIWSYQDLTLLVILKCIYMLLFLLFIIKPGSISMLERTLRGPHFTDKDLEVQRETATCPNCGTSWMTLLSLPQGRHPSLGMKHRLRRSLQPIRPGLQPINPNEKSSGFSRQPLSLR